MSSSPCSPSPPIAGGDGLGVGGGGRDDPRPAQVLQFGGHVAGRGVDVVMSAQLAGEVALLGATRDRDGAKTHLHRELHPEMTQATNPEDGDQIAGPGAGAGAAS